MRWTRDQYLDLMTFGDAPRRMFSELFGPLVGLPEEWRQQGASDDEIAMDAFDWDYVPYIDCGAELGVFGAPEPIVIEDTEEHRVERDGLGRTTKLFKRNATIPLPLDHPVKKVEDWERLKPFFAFREDRIDPALVEDARARQRQGVLVKASMPGGFDLLRELMGEARACLAFYDTPELVQDMLSTVQQTAVTCLERVGEHLTLDQLSVHEDMAGSTGPLIGPWHVTEFLQPYYRACWETASAHGARLFNQDSDGDMRPVLDAFLACGVNVIHPCEPPAGMDIVALRQRYGEQLAMLGGIDKHVLRRGERAIREELEAKLRPELGPGIVFSLDHRVPNGTPLAAYRYYVALGRRMLGLPPLDGTRRGWGRMAF